MLPQFTRQVLAVIVALGFAATAGAAIAATDSGGTAIANAPDVVLNTQIVSGVTDNRIASVCDSEGFSGEFWHVPMAAGDRLTVDVGSTDGGNVHVAVFRPSVTDYTLGEAGCGDADVKTDAKAELRFRAPTGGRWTILVIDSPTYGDGSNSTVAYEMTVHVQAFSQVALAAPSLAATHKNVVVRGVVKGVTSGNVEIQTAQAGDAWKSTAVAAVSQSGAFSWTTKPSHPGTYRVRAIYPGDDSHLPSRATLAIRVVGR